MDVLQRRALALMIRVATWASSVRWILLGTVLAALGILQLFLPVPAAVNVVLATLSAALVGLDVKNHRRRQRSTIFTPRLTDDFQDVRAAMAGSARFELFDFQGGTFMHDRSMSAAFSNTSVMTRMESRDYVIPIEFRELGRLFQRRRVHGNTHAYNDPVLGLDSNLGLDDGAPLPTSISVIGSRYWDYLASDLFAGHEVSVEGRHRPDLGRRLVIDRRGVPRDFADSWLLNAIGVSVLAITSDGLFVVVTQSDRNDSAQGQLAPTGSGSLEPKDFRGNEALPWVELCVNGALREAAEESGLRPSDIASVHSLGFGRWLEKAAKPEALMLALLSVDSHEVRRREVPRADRAFTLAVEAHRFASRPDDWQPHRVTTMVDAEVGVSLSVPLAACLALLADLVHVDASVRGELSVRGCGR